jgi:hypothetical protein
MQEADADGRGKTMLAGYSREIADNAETKDGKGWNRFAGISCSRRDTGKTNGSTPHGNHGTGDGNVERPAGRVWPRMFTKALRMKDRSRGIAQQLFRFSRTGVTIVLCPAPNAEHMPNG